MTSVLECIESGTGYLAKKGVEDARRNMQLLVAHHLKCTRTQLYMRFDEPLDERVLAPLRIDLKKRGERVPLQHLLGVVPFFKHDFLCDSRALIPRPETEELVEILLKELPCPPATVLDLGCGSGVIGISLALAWPETNVTLADISTAALELSSENIDNLGATNAHTIESNLFCSLAGKTFDLIVANLPYVPEIDRPSLTPEVLHDPELALFSGNDGMDLLRRFCHEVASYLNPGGVIALEIGIDQDQHVTEFLRQAGMKEIRVIADLSGTPRFPLAKFLH